jgi:hypothetical protein
MPLMPQSVIIVITMQYLDKQYRPIMIIIILLKIELEIVERME